MAADLLEQHPELDRPEPHPALGLGHRDAEPALLDHRRPEVPVPALGRLGDGADPGRGREIVEERAGAVPERELVLREVEVHRRADTI